MKTKYKVVIGLAAMLLVACNNSNNDRSNVAQTPGYNPGAYWTNDVTQCMGCFPNAQPLLRGVQAAAGGGVLGSGATNLIITMDILGDPLRGANISDPNSVQYYNGGVMVAGAMRITNQDWLSCGATPGDYTLRTVTPGMMAGTTINGMVVEAISTTTGIRLNMRWSAMTPYNDTGYGLNGATTTNRMGMAVTIDMINGTPCGSSFVTY